MFGRRWIQQGGGVLAADAPMLHFTMMELFRAASLRELVSDYLGEPALISVHKTTLRKADPSIPGAWHQDGYFMGDVRSLNLWLSLSRCGDVAPGLDIVPRRLDQYVATATDEAVLDYTISQQKVEEAAGEHRLIRPIFEPGDAMFFDERFLHQTGSLARDAKSEVRGRELVLRWLGLSRGIRAHCGLAHRDAGPGPAIPGMRLTRDPTSSRTTHDSTRWPVGSRTPDVGARSITHPAVHPFVASGLVHW